MSLCPYRTESWVIDRESTKEFRLPPKSNRFLPVARLIFSSVVHSLFISRWHCTAVCSGITCLLPVVHMRDQTNCRPAWNKCILNHCLEYISLFDTHVFYSIPWFKPNINVSIRSYLFDLSWIQMTFTRRENRMLVDRYYMSSLSIYLWERISRTNFQHKIYLRHSLSTALPNLTRLAWVSRIFSQLSLFRPHKFYLTHFYFSVYRVLQIVLYGSRGQYKIICLLCKFLTLPRSNKIFFQ